MDKYSHADVPNINSTCFKLNSLQLQALLQNYHCAPDEPLIPTVSLLSLTVLFNIPEEYRLKVKRLAENSCLSVDWFEIVPGRVRVVNLLSIQVVSVVSVCFRPPTLVSVLHCNLSRILPKISLTLSWNVR